jgi:hypothetical protein
MSPLVCRLSRSHFEGFRSKCNGGRTGWVCAVCAQNSAPTSFREENGYMTLIWIALQRDIINSTVQCNIVTFLLFRDLCVLLALPMAIARVALGAKRQNVKYLL